METAEPYDNAPEGPPVKLSRPLNVADVSGAPLNAPSTPTAPGQTAAPPTPTAAALASAGGTEAGPAPASVTAGGAAVPPAAAERGAAGAVSATAYALLSAAGLAMAALLLFAPATAAKYTFRKSAASPLDAQHCQLMQLVGSALLVTASAAASLALAAGGRWGRLSPEGTDVLRLGLAGQALVALAADAYHASTLRASSWPFKLAWGGALLALTGRDLLSRGFDLQGTPGQVIRWASTHPGSLLAGAYTLLAQLFLAHSLTLIFATKDAAKRGVLRSPAALTLNAGTLLASLLHARVLLPLLPSEWGGQGAITGWFLPLAAATALAAALTSAAGLAAALRLPDVAAPAVAEAVEELTLKED